MSKGMALLLGVIALAVISVILWGGQGGFAHVFQEKDAQTWAAFPSQFISSSQCQSCHQPVYTLWVASTHQTVNCEICHGGLASDHLQGKGKPLIDTSQTLCGVCHAKVQGRRSDFPQVDLKEHAGSSTCVTCHKPHAPSLGGARGR